MPGKLQDRPALVIGAGAGIGRAIAIAFAREGAAVLCADLDGGSAAAVAAEIAAKGGCAAAQPCDVSDSASAREAVAAAVAAFGGLRILVNGAATFTTTASVDVLDEAEWHRAIAVNLTGAFLASRHAVPHIRAAGGGSIIHIASQMGRVANMGQAAYCTTKGGLLQLAKTMALDHAQEGIRVNTLSPGGVATARLTRRFGDMETAERLWGPKHPLGRLGRPEEIAAAAVFLASDDSSFMTGADLLVDGGYTAW
ncbi:MAG: SDR family NAD(P)-dependent oxidoreductase [Alphaproteobacteria bacterium]